MSDELAAACLKAEAVNAIELQEGREKFPGHSENDPNKYGWSSRQEWVEWVEGEFSAQGIGAAV